MYKSNEPWIDADIESLSREEEASHIHEVEVKVNFSVNVKLTLDDREDSITADNIIDKAYSKLKDEPYDLDFAEIDKITDNGEEVIW